ncbi:MAG: 16S rRNA (uracil(1498)-N(3))-methyltransferase [Candidatus Paceibacterota bacterium]|jgi:16S rRNA (uracil1498-N3)-methyltransferase
MRLHRFYISEQLQVGKEIRVEDAELLNQWGKVFRLSAGDKVILFNGEGSDFETTFKILSKKEAVLVIDKEIENKNTSKTELHIFQSIIKKDNFELIVQKCTEIGTFAFHPVISERSEKKDLNTERLVKISKEASEQSFRTTVPKIFEPLQLEKALENFDGEPYVLDFDGENIKNINANKIGLVIGPEGGWSGKEREYFKTKNIKSVSLGNPVLRAETAAIVGSALILLK